MRATQTFRLGMISLLMAFAANAPAHAKVESVDAQGFTARYVMETTQTPQAAYRAFTQLKAWWPGDHTYSGNAANLRLEARAGGCWCERLESGGFVEHMRVSYADPGKAIRLLGALGPGQEMGANGALTLRFVAKEGGGTKVEAVYAVSGHAKMGWEKLAPIMDGVLGGAFARYQQSLDAKPQ